MEQDDAKGSQPRLPEERDADRTAEIASEFVVEMESADGAVVGDFFGREAGWKFTLRSAFGAAEIRNLR
jgi:hypothetical protein